MAKLHVITARDEPIAVILRRGPSAWYHVILWQTRRDTFSHGAWFKGRIYEDKCDLSPDGSLFVYFVHQGSRGGTEFTHAWTAVSRPPWLHALVLWPQGTTYGGGGQFTAPRELYGVSEHATHSQFPFPSDGLTVASNPPPLREKCQPIADSDWTGRDHRGSIIHTKGDMLLRRNKNSDAVVADFSGLQPAPSPAPDWATRPL
jgi:hypothetical protein